MKQIIIDGVIYDGWTPPKEDDLETIVQEHAEDIFGEQSIYFNIKTKLKSAAGIGSIPDGYCIVLRDKPSWYIVEVELSNHDLYNHIYSQLGKFLSGIKNTPSQHQIVDAIYDEINREELLKVRFKKALGNNEIHKFLSDLISTPPIIAVIIEKETPQLMEVIERLKHPPTEVVEFQTFVRRDIGEKVHAHLFEPLEKAATKKPEKEGEPPKKSKLVDTQLEFWSKFKAYAEQRNFKLPLRKPSPNYWYDISYGGPKSHISLQISAELKRLVCAIWISDAKNVFHTFFNNRVKIEQELGEKLEWNELPDKKASHIRLVRDGDLGEVAKWDEYFKWFMKKAENFQEVFLKYAEQ